VKAKIEELKKKKNEIDLEDVQKSKNAFTE